MSKRKRAERYIGKKIRTWSGWVFRVHSVEVVPLVQNGIRIYHPSYRTRTHALMFKGSCGNKIDYEHVNARARHEIVE